MVWQVQDIEDLAVARGRVWRTDITSGSITSATSYYYGITTAALEVISFNRKYSGTAPAFRAALYEATWSGGTDPQMYNRRLASTRPVPFTLKTGVTPGTLSAVLFSATIRAGVATGNAQAGFTDSRDAVIFKPNTSYVVQLENLGAAVAVLDASFDLRSAEILFAFSEFGG